MRISSSLIVMAALATAALLSVLAATVAVGRIEQASSNGVVTLLAEHEITWASVKADGLQLRLSGTAPSEADRFRALSLAGEVVDTHRVLDEMTVREAEAIAPPQYSVEILRNDDGVSLIGLIPRDTDRDTVVARISEIAGEGKVTDLLETADYETPEGWSATLAFALEALESLPRSKISVIANAITVTAITGSVEERSRIEAKLLDAAPDGLDLMLDLSAPRPVITPFTLRYLVEEGKGRFDACSADTESTRARIIRAAERAGLEGEAECTVGLGQPSPRWAEAVETGIAALAEIGGGSVTFSDADVTLVAAEDTPQALFDRVVGELEADLPEVFSLHSVLPEPVSIDGTGEGDGPPEFVATLSPEGLVQLRGRLTDERVRTAVESYARARFGREEVYAATRLDPELPAGWPLRVLAGLEAMDELNNGQVVVQPDFVEIRGVTGNAEAKAEISRILSDKLGEAQNFAVEVTYKEEYDPQAALPSPEECVTGINEVLTGEKINFAPGSADIAPGAGRTLDRLAEIVKTCEHVKMEIGGHTDSQGREEMNLNLSQGRADAVLNALMARRVLTGNLVAKGYGETRPIADNDTEEGREANRRIAFTLVAEDAEGDAAGTPEEEAAPAGQPDDAASGDDGEQDAGEEQGAEGEQTGSTDEQN